jgi:hypothetical protein
MAAVGREELDYPAKMSVCFLVDVLLDPYQLPLLISVSMVAGPSSIMGGTVSPLKMVSGVLSSQSSFLAVACALGVSAASVEANVASDRREYIMERIAAMAEGRATRVKSSGPLARQQDGCCVSRARWAGIIGITTSL